MSVPSQAFTLFYEKTPSGKVSVKLMSQWGKEIYKTTESNMTAAKKVGNIIVKTLGGFNDGIKVREITLKA